MATNYTKPISQLKFGTETYQIKDAELNKEISNYLPLSGGTMTGNINIPEGTAISVGYDGADDTTVIDGNGITFIGKGSGKTFNIGTYGVSNSDWNQIAFPTVETDDEFALKSQIDDIKQKIAGGVHFKGLNTGTGTNILTDGGNQTPVIAGYTEKAVGDIVMQNETGPDGKTVTVEYIYTKGETWEKLGANDTTNFGDLAYKNTASASYTPAGTVGISATTIGDQTLNITTKTFTGSKTDVAGTITMKALTGTYDLTCEEISVKASFAGTPATIQPSADFGNASPSATVSYTPTSITKSLDLDDIAISAAYTSTFQPTVSAYGHTQEAIADASITNTSTSLTCTSTVTGTSIAGAITGTAAITNSLFGTSNVINSTTYTASTETLEFTTTSVFDKCATNASAPLTLASKANITVNATGTYSKATSFTAKYSKLNSIIMNNTTVAGYATQTVKPTGDVTFSYDKTSSVAVKLPSIVCSPISYTPAGTVTTTEFTPAGTVTLTETPVVSAFALSCTPSGTINVAGSVNIPAHDHKAAFGGTAATITVS